MIWAPVLFVFKHLVPLADNASLVQRMACRGPIVFFVGLTGPICVMLTVGFAHRIALRFVGRGVSLTAAVIGALGSLLAIFGPLWWNYAHVYAAASLTLGMLFFVRTTENEARIGHWIGTGASLGLAALCRPHHMVWMLAPFLLTVVAGVAAIRRREVPYRQALRGLACLAGFAALFWIRLASYDFMYGSPWPPVLRAVYLQPGHAHPFLLLFSGRAGLVTYAPLMWLAIVGFVLFLRRPRLRTITVPLALALMLDVWICSSPLDWPGGATVGPRLLTSFCGLFVVFIALTLDVIRRWATKTPRRLLRFATVGWLLPPLLFSWQLTRGDGPYDAPSLYGTAFRGLVEDLNRHVGNPLAFPAPLVFSARYRTPPADFDRVATYGLFQHDFERGRLLGGDRFSFLRPPSEVVLREGLSSTPRGRRVSPSRAGRFLVTLSWPYVTAVRIELASPPGRDGCRVRVANATFFSRERSGDVRVPRDATSVFVEVPRGMFDSGINETFIRSNCGLELGSFTFVDDSDAANATPLPHYRNDPRFR